AAPRGPSPDGVPRARAPPPAPPEPAADERGPGAHAGPPRGPDVAGCASRGARAVASARGIRRRSTATLGRDAPAMTSLVQVVAIAVSVLLLLLVLDLVRRRQLREEYSLIWIACAGALLVLSIWRDLLDALARRLGVYYPPAVLLLILILFVFVAC